MENEQPKPSFPAGTGFSEKAKEAIQTGITWLNQWYQKRKDIILPNGDPILTDEAKQKISEKIKNLKFYGGDKVVDELQQGMANGELHPTPLGVESWQDDKYIQNMKEHTKDVDSLGCTWSNIEESPIYLNEDHILKNQPNGYLSKDKLVGVIGGMDEFAVHEGTHVLDVDPHTDSRVGYITNTDILSSYRNQPREIYARLNNLRYRMQADPTKVFTVEEVAALRKKCEEDMRYFEEKSKEPNVDFEKLVKEPGRFYDDMLFDRFSDEQICRLLNEVALNRDNKQLDELHKGDRMHNDIGTLNIAAIQRQPAAKSTIEQMPHRGMRMG